MPEVTWIYGCMDLVVQHARLSSSSSVMAEVGVLPELPVIGQSCPSTSSDTGLSAVVGRTERCVTGCSLCPYSTNQNCSHQCLNNRWGSAFRNVNGSGFVVGARSIMSYQRIGASRHLQSVSCLTGSDLGAAVHIFTNNITTKYYVNKQGRACSNQLCQEAIKLWHFCINEDIIITATCLLGSQNQMADHLSRIFSDNHKSSMVKSIFREWDIALVNLFAIKKPRSAISVFPEQDSVQGL